MVRLRELQRPPELMAGIAEAGGPATSDSWWVEDHDVTGSVMPDEETDAVEPSQEASADLVVRGYGVPVS